MSVKVRVIEEGDWEMIMVIQEASYFLFEPESLDVMQDKAAMAGECCWVAESEGAVVGYLLCHPWPAFSAPPLGQRLPRPSLQTESSTLEFYMHDLAVHPSQRGRSVATKLIRTALTWARAQGYLHASLVAVQDAPSFWLKHGFQAASCSKPLDQYGKDASYMRLSLSDLSSNRAMK